MGLGGRQDGLAVTGAERLFALLLMLVMGAAWGGALNLAKLAVSHGGHPVGLALWQTVCSGLILLSLSLLRRRPPDLAPPVIRFNLVCGLFGLAIPAVGLFWAARYLPAGIVAMAFATMPLFTYGLSALIRAERLEPLRLLGVVIGLAAVALVVLPASALPEPGQAPWVLLAIGCGLSMSLENIYIAARRPPGRDSIALSCGRQLAAGVILVPLVVATGTAVPVFVTWGPVQWAATGMALVSALAYTIFIGLIRGTGAVYASQTAYLITLAGVFWGMAIFGERHSPYIWATLGLLFLGLTLVRLRRGAAAP